LKLNGTHQLLVYADDVNIIGGSVHTMQENAKSLLMAGRNFVLEENANKTKYMVIFRDHNAGRIHSIEVDNNSF